MGEVESMASKVTRILLPHGAPLQLVPLAAFKPVITGGVVSTSKRSLIFSPVSASLGV